MTGELLGRSVTMPEGRPEPRVAVGSEYEMVDREVVALEVGGEVTEPETVVVAVVVEPPAPGLSVTVGKMVVVTVVLEMMVVGPLKITVLPSPKMATAVWPEIAM